MTQTINKFLIGNNTELLLDIQSGVFVPTATTTSLINAVKGYLKTPGKLLDLGAGSGVVGIALSLNKMVDLPLYASDLSCGAIECISNNCERYEIPVTVKEGSLLEPWVDEKFDYIIDDISGIAEEVANLSPWFDNVPCVSGDDGTDLTIQVLQNAPTYLNKGGLLFFPVISFSNVDKIVGIARENFTNVELLCRDEWPMPKEMYQHTKVLKRLQQEGHIQYKDMFGMILCFTDIYVAYNEDVVS